MNAQSMTNRASSISASPVAAIAGFCLLPVAFLGPNVALVAYAALVLAVGMTLLMRPAGPPMPMFIFLYQWLQAALGPIYGNIFGIEINDLAQNLGEHAVACFLELSGVMFLALGMRVAIGRRGIVLTQQMVAFVGSRSVGFWFRIYLGASIFGALCATFAYSAGGLTQPLLSLAQIKWAGFVLLTFATFAIPGRSKAIWIAVAIFEFGLSIGGFFSSFKDIFFYSIIGILGSGIKLRPMTVAVMGFFGSILLALGVIWTSVKIDYRDFSNGGSGQQAVNASYSERIAYLGQLVGSLDRPTLADGVDTLAHRVMYFEFFGAALGNVPLNVPHTDGALWGRAILTSFMPRLIFTDKAAVHDSELTREYTGIRVTSYEQGTSISMGYMAEAYIDFGRVFMMAPIFLLGYGLGSIHRWLLTRPGRDGVLGAAMSTFTLMQANAVETSGLKLIPAVLLCVVACLIVFKFIAPLIWGVERVQMRAKPKPRLREA